MELVGIIGTIVVVIAIAVVIGVWIYLKRRSRPTYELRYGSKVYCQDAKHMKKRKLDVEDEINRFMMLTNFKFPKQRVVKELEDLQISFKSKPFPPEGNVVTNAKLLSGVHIPDKKRIVVCVIEGKDLKDTAFNHELMHYIMLQLDEVIDYSHVMKEYWNLLRG